MEWKREKEGSRERVQNLSAEKGFLATSSSRTDAPPFAVHAQQSRHYRLCLCRRLPSAINIVHRSQKMKLNEKKQSRLCFLTVFPLFLYREFKGREGKVQLKQKAMSRERGERDVKEKQARAALFVLPFRTNCPLFRFPLLVSFEQTALPCACSALLLFCCCSAV